MKSKASLARAARVVLPNLAAFVLADCAVASTPAREAAEKAAQLTIIKGQVQPALRACARRAPWVAVLA